jgi:hypothetical protein
VIAVGFQGAMLARVAISIHQRPPPDIGTTPVLVSSLLDDPDFTRRDCFV